MCDASSYLLGLFLHDLSRALPSHKTCLSKPTTYEIRYIPHVIKYCKVRNKAVAVTTHIQEISHYILFERVKNQDSGPVPTKQGNCIPLLIKGLTVESETARLIGCFTCLIINKN
jgi:hypothetical protein